ncbi:MAG TPA: hypothetical protein PKD34_02430, partial [Candidatus Doudnabacteria bacterium]|nr:hypothetical protein [Candidatus Doudnabacteria bacterium]
MTYSQNTIIRTLIFLSVFITGLLISLVFFSNQVSAQFFPAEIYEATNTLSPDQNSVSIFVRGYGACLDSIDPDNSCARSEYVDIGVNLDIQRIVNNAHGGDQWEGNLYYPEETTQWRFPGFPTPEQVDPVGFNSIINTSAWPSGTYRFCATVGGSITALWPQDAYASQSLCATPFTIIRPVFTELVCGITQSVYGGEPANYIISAGGNPSLPVSVTMSSNPSGPVLNNSPLILNSGNSYTGVATVDTSVLDAGNYTLTFSGTDGTNTFECDSLLEVIDPDRGDVYLLFDGSEGPTTPTPPDGESGTLSWDTEGTVDYCTPSMAQGDSSDWTGLGTLGLSGSAVVSKLVGGETYEFQIDCVTLGGMPVGPKTVVVEVGMGAQIPTATLLCLGHEGKSPSGGPCEVSYG